MLQPQINTATTVAPDHKQALWQTLLEVIDQESIPVVPSLGRVPAGIPVEAVEDRNRDDLISLLTTPGRYALKVCGDSMMDAGIYDGDTIIVQSQQQASNGDIVIALIDNENVTLKRYKSMPSGQIILIADNPSFDNCCYDADRITIQGRVVGQIRRF